MTGDSSRPHSRSQLDAWLNAELDGELTASQRTSLEQANQDVSDDRAELRTIDHDLRGALVRDGDRAQRFVDTVISRLPAEAAGQPPNRIEPSLRVTPFVLGAAAGFVIAACVFGPSFFAQKRLASAPDQPTKIDAPSLKGAAGRAVRLRGKVALGSTKSKGQQPLTAGQVFSESSRITTEDNAICEIELNNGMRILLDRSSEIIVRSDSGVRHVRGRVTVSAHGSKGGGSIALELAGGSVALGTAGDSSIEIRGDLRGQRVLALGGQVRVVSNAMKAKSREATLDPGQAISLDKRKGLYSVQRAVDPIVATSWTHRLLDRAELTPRIEQLVVASNRGKRLPAETLIRELGPLGGEILAGLTLTSDRFDDNVRGDTAEIAAELVSARAIPTLIEFLEHENGSVRASGQRGLIRLTGERIGGDPDDWLNSSATAMKTRSLHVDQWRQWWSENHQRFERD